MKIFAYPHFYAGNTMTLLFFHEIFEKIGKISKNLKLFFNFSKIFHGTIIAPLCSQHKNVDMQNLS
jgi:hypothetical protein